MKLSFYHSLSIATLILTIVTTSVCFAHKGQLDSSGGHHNHETGAYHFHSDIHQGEKVNGLYKPPATRAEIQIMLLQAALKYLGYYSGEVNGKQDAKTTHGLKSFQLTNDLVVTGYMNEKTKIALYEKLKEKPLKY